MSPRTPLPSFASQRSGKRAGVSAPEGLQTLRESVLAPKQGRAPAQGGKSETPLDGGEKPVGGAQKAIGFPQYSSSSQEVKKFLDSRGLVSRYPGNRFPQKRVDTGNQKTPPSETRGPGRRWVRNQSLMACQVEVKGKEC